MPGAGEARLNAQPGCQSTDVLKRIEYGLHRYMRRVHPTRLVYRVYRYTFSIEGVEFLARDRLAVRLGVYYPKDADSWTADVVVTLRMGKVGASRRVSLESIKSLSFSH